MTIGLTYDLGLKHGHGDYDASAELAKFIALSL